ncbi:hypothetical protein L226DRAFT_218656 [Lentinus tigrinus ALCF2SS1-7]|uniref:Uncharacterized protein n=1 Tax=Lentinus tigrinus ALCF2SS1-6 TaxID=1328759 RepID=A0A5C2SBB7_9APHY|nr:hypothetical protein L227DRAFT_102306 [Lentinus tigrinus ALCF2SS1-6]RPD70952.1 hypothetical protein L226DRAFT_218656 [Lentinus tigrinus ALCF2SS1-7]
MYVTATCEWLSNARFALMHMSCLYAELYAYRSAPRAMSSLGLHCSISDGAFNSCSPAACRQLVDTRRRSRTCNLLTPGSTQSCAPRSDHSVNANTPRICEAHPHLLEISSLSGSKWLEARTRTPVRTEFLLAFLPHPHPPSNASPQSCAVVTSMRRADRQAFIVNALGLGRDKDLSKRRAVSTVHRRQTRNHVNVCDSSRAPSRIVCLAEVLAGTLGSLPCFTRAGKAHTLCGAGALKLGTSEPDSLSLSGAACSCSIRISRREYQNSSRGLHVPARPDLPDHLCSFRSLATAVVGVLTH